MRLFLQLALDKPAMPVDYRPIFVSFIKRCLSECNNDLFDEYYSKQKPATKAMSFAVKFDRPVFGNDMIALGGTRVLLTVTVSDQREGIILYNAFINSKGYALPLAGANRLCLSSVRVMQDRKIDDENILIKFLSPLVVRFHLRDNVDRYLNVDDETEEFQTHLKEVVKNEIKALAEKDCSTDDFSLEPIKAQTTVVKSFGCMIPASLGIFRLTGRPELIRFLYQAGIGSRRSEGFGLFEIIG